MAPHASHTAMQVMPNFTKHGYALVEAPKALHKKLHAALLVSTLALAPPMYPIFGMLAGVSPLFVLCGAYYTMFSIIKRYNARLGVHESL